MRCQAGCGVLERHVRGCALQVKTERPWHIVSIPSRGENPLKAMRKLGMLDWLLEIADLVRSQFLFILSAVLQKRS